jgi:hypothetical protein
MLLLLVMPAAAAAAAAVGCLPAVCSQLDRVAPL